MRLIAIAVIAIGCKKAAAPEATLGSGSGSGSGSALAAPVAIDATVAIATPTWTLETAPIDVECGDAPLEVEKPQATKPVGDRTLQRSPGIAACHGLGSVAAVCDCLAASAGKWAANTLTTPATCEVATIEGLTDAHAALVNVSTNPPENATKVGGRAFVLVAQQGSTWSAVDSVESQEDIDLAVTPKRSGTAKIDRVDVEPGVGGTLYVIQSRSWTSEHAVGELDAEGRAQVTICSIPSAPEARAFCYLPLSLGAWDFTHDDSSDKCTVRSGDLFAATISATAATLRVAHGKDSQGEAGRYVLTPTF